MHRDKAGLPSGGTFRPMVGGGVPRKSNMLSTKSRSDTSHVGVEAETQLESSPKLSRDKDRFSTIYYRSIPYKGKKKFFILQ